jgi:hypothetical protein
MKKSITAVLALLMFTFAAPAQAGKFNDFFAGIFTILTAPIGIFCPNVALFKRNNPWRKKDVEVEKIIHTDSLKTKLSSVQDKALVFLEEITEKRKEMKKAEADLKDIREKAAKFVAENKASTEGPDATSKREAVIKYNEKVEKHNEKIVSAFKKDYVPKLLNYLNSSMKLNNAFVEVSHLKGSDEQTIERYRTEAFSLRKMIDEINEKFKEFKDLSYAEICSKSLKEFTEFFNYIYCIRGNCSSQQKS